MARILVIEDEAPIRGNLLRFIRLEGYEAVEATDGRSGLLAVHDQLPDLIFCDVMMPQLNGLDLLAAIQRAPALRHIPLIFLSASAEPELLDEALRRGASGYLTKPFNFTQLRAVLQQHLPLRAAAGSAQPTKLALD
ncbi:Response regulator receiver domain-containing protein [Rhodoferax sp. OV413]|uniref:response regulator n=1 Tax=Rhodoferax sp. OV413 TaxID=1855285 RepID=UPI00087F4E89|nr:response regulator [Rhodoferax sp. OV413]SDP81841.1 Response regulator receiver domain-containing protein [Rhodoferax sp. OV413]